MVWWLKDFMESASPEAMACTSRVNTADHGVRVGPLRYLERPHKHDSGQGVVRLDLNWVVKCRLQLANGLAVQLVCLYSPRC